MVKAKNEETVEIKEVTTEETKEVETKKVRKTRKPRTRKVKEEIIHNFISKHSVLTEEEKEEFSQNYNIEKLPFIFISDAGIKHLEVNIGDIIKIIRNNDIVGETIYYRRVVNEE